jgi:RNA ligase
VFDHTGRVVAFPFPKFFNYGEHIETRGLPNEPFVATTKHDGHLGIIFEYDGDLHITTRGSFLSKTSVFSADMLAQYKERWLKALPKSVCPLVEIIHPETFVHKDYNGWTGFILIGAFNRRTYADFDYEQLQALAGKLGIECTSRWEGSSIADLVELMKDLTVQNQEGFVARFSSGLRVKFKFASYIALMIGGKLNVRYVMRRLMDGTLDKRVADLPGEVQAEADRLKELVLGVKGVEGCRKDRWAFLYELETDEEERTDTYKALCRSFQAWLVRTGQMPAVR